MSVDLCCYWVDFFVHNREILWLIPQTQDKKTKAQRPGGPERQYIHCLPVRRGVGGGRMGKLEGKGEREFGICIGK